VVAGSLQALPATDNDLPRPRMPERARTWAREGNEIVSIARRIAKNICEDLWRRFDRLIGLGPGGNHAHADLHLAARGERIPALRRAPR
jgi:hypothetical protein